MRFLFPLLLVVAALATVLLPGCEPKENLLTTDGSAKLEFSLDTVKFDTVFVSVGTVSKRLWVYNRQARAVRVAEISLQSQPGVTYGLLVNGDAGLTIRDVEIRGKDSLLVLVRATVDPTPTSGKPFLVVDDLLFRTNGNDQAVKVLSYGQNAYFHDNEVIRKNTVWKADKPHVIYNSVLVDSLVTLTIEAGARIYSHAGSFLVVRGRLLCNPTYQPASAIEPDDPNIVRFQGDRREKQYADTPGQWGGLEFDASSQNNVLRFTEIKNSAFGLLIFNPFNRQPHPRVRIENAVLSNISTLNGSYSLDGAALLSVSGDFTVRNTLITNCEQYAVFGVQGSQYQLDYCTVANYLQNNRLTPSVLLAPAIEINGQQQPAVAPRLTVRNSILWGTIRDGDELEFVDGEQYADNISIRNSLLKTKKYGNAADALGQQKNGNILNPDEFVSSLFRSSPSRFRGTQLDFRLDTLSPASNQALPLSGLPTDLLNRPRDPSTPDIGAYERVDP